jgi:hypothetical protein
MINIRNNNLSEHNRHPQHDVSKQLEELSTIVIN